jgi:hypothetical protein
MRSLVVVFLLVVAFAGCSSPSPGDGEACPAIAHAAFHVELRAEGGALPPDARIRVVFGGGEETWALDAPSAVHESVFCRARDAADAETDAGPKAALACELWTSGAAQVEVSAAGFATLSRDLEAEADACGIVTTDVELVLERGD